jgi:hypothetical protein
MQRKTHSRAQAILLQLDERKIFPAHRHGRKSLRRSSQLHGHCSARRRNCVWSSYFVALFGDWVHLFAVPAIIGGALRTSEEQVAIQSSCCLSPVIRKRCLIFIQYIRNRANWYTSTKAQVWVRLLKIYSDATMYLWPCTSCTCQSKIQSSTLLSIYLSTIY